MIERYLAAGVEWLNYPRHYQTHPGYAARFDCHGFRFVTDHPHEAPLTDDDQYMGICGCRRRGDAGTDPEYTAWALAEMAKLPAKTKRPFPPAALAPAPVTKYEVVVSQSLTGLEEVVDAKLMDGWVCQGGVAMDSEGFYLQAMTRTTP